VVIVELDRVFPELDCVVLYLPAAMKHRQGGQTKLPATGSSSGPESYGSPRVQAVPGKRCLVGQSRVFIGATGVRLVHGRNPGVFQGHNRPLQRNLQHFIHGFHEMHLQAGEYLLRNFR
jgi:hypothetical protein